MLQQIKTTSYKNYSMSFSSECNSCTVCSMNYKDLLSSEILEKFSYFISDSNNQFSVRLVESNVLRKAFSHCYTKIKSVKWTSEKDASSLLIYGINNKFQSYIRINS